MTGSIRDGHDVDHLGPSSVQPGQAGYPSDLTDEEWGHLEHLIPPAKRGGRRREIDEREVVNGLL